MKPNQNSGNDSATVAKPVVSLSKKPPGRSPAASPSASPKTIEMTKAMAASVSVTGSRSSSTAVTGRRSRMESPRSPCTRSPTNDTYWSERVAASPSERRISAMLSAELSMPPMMVAASPGSARTARNTSVSTTHSVRTRLTSCPRR